MRWYKVETRYVNVFLSRKKNRYNYIVSGFWFGTKTKRKKTKKMIIFAIECEQNDQTQERDTKNPTLDE